MDFDEATPLVIALAQEFISGMRRIDPNWKEAFWRFESESDRYGSNASYVHSEGVNLISVLKEKQLFEGLNERGRKLWDCETDSARKFCVCLLIVKANLDYEIKFELADMNRWRITKLDGKSGMPEGLSST